MSMYSKLHQTAGFRHILFLVFLLLAVTSLVHARPSGTTSLRQHTGHGGQRPRPGQTVPGNRHNPYPIPRPGHCKHNDRVFADCFLCGKIADESKIYHGCCNQTIETVTFCERLLS